MLCARPLCDQLPNLDVAHTDADQANGSARNGCMARMRRREGFSMLQPTASGSCPKKTPITCAPQPPAPHASLKVADLLFSRSHMHGHAVWTCSLLGTSGASTGAECSVSPSRAVLSFRICTSICTTLRSVQLKELLVRSAFRYVAV